MDDRGTTSGAALPQVVLDAQSDLKTTLATFRMSSFIRQDGIEPQSPIVVLQLGELESLPRPLVRVHSKCTTSEVFGSRHCDCSDQLRIAMEQIVAEGVGLIIYLDQEARGNGMRAKLQIYARMERYDESSYDACVALGYPPDQRTYDGAAAVLRYIGLDRIRLLTNNPQKSDSLRAFGIDVEEVRIVGPVTPFNRQYLTEKQVRFQHNLGLTESDTGSASAVTAEPSRRPSS